ncbi:MAG TPA: SUMF1/EgtB/PvdO family nonheme iron enzyme [Candidatus Obscuribacterales bacterium]
MPDSITQRNQQRDLRELEYAFRSQQLFLEHIEIRFARLLRLLEPLLPAWKAQEESRQALETELESTCQEVGFLQREIQTLERILGRQDESRQIRWSGRVQELETTYLQLDGWLDTSQQRIEAMEETVSGLLEQAQEKLHLLAEIQAGHRQTIEQIDSENRLALVQLQTENQQEIERLLAENRHLAAALAAFEETEQEYLRLLEHKEQQLQELTALYEFELGQLSGELSRSGQDQSREQQQTLGRSLARLAQERNSVIQDQQSLRDHVEDIETENRQLKQTLAQTQSEKEQIQGLAGSWQEHFGPHVPMEVLSYCHFWETIQGLELDLPETLYQQLGEALRLPESERALIESRLRLQPGRLQRFLSDWSTQHPDALSRRSPTQQTRKGTPETGLLRIPAGKYPIGDDLHPAERPAHSYETAGFAIARLPVSNADFARFMAAGGYQNPDFWLPEGWNFIQAEALHGPAFWQKRGYACGPDYPDYPVIGISWYEAVAYATWADLRLPSEVEWEAAGRGPDGLRWPWGNEWRDGLANTAEAGINNTTPVGIFPEGASPFGCLDLVGNVFEWTLSLYQSYPYRPDDGREDLRSVEPRTLRGCSWNHRGHYFTRLSYRFQAEPTTRHSDIGFRLAQ